LNNICRLPPFQLAQGQSLELQLFNKLILSHFFQ
jgi:hypothetical protein